MHNYNDKYEGRLRVVNVSDSKGKRFGLEPPRKPGLLHMNTIRTLMNENSAKTRFIITKNNTKFFSVST